jgi:hypothetical protein
VFLERLIVDSGSEGGQLSLQIVADVGGQIRVPLKESFYGPRTLLRVVVAVFAGLLVGIGARLPPLGCSIISIGVLRVGGLVVVRDLGVDVVKGSLGAHGCIYLFLLDTEKLGTMSVVLRLGGIREALV